MNKHDGQSQAQALGSIFVLLTHKLFPASFSPNSRLRVHLKSPRGCVMGILNLTEPKPNLVSPLKPVLRLIFSIFIKSSSGCQVRNLEAIPEPTSLTSLLCEFLPPALPSPRTSCSLPHFTFLHSVGLSPTAFSLPHLSLIFV